jgi:ubiquinone/menaquinone biosynthesis C-methylase UbiE
MVMENKEYFEYLKDRNSISFLFRRYFYKSLLKEFNGKVLDVGCGIGEFLDFYKNSYGIEVNPFLVKYCKEKGLNVKLGSIYKIPFKGNMFDVVLCSHVLEHLEKPNIAIKEMRRVLKPKGKLILLVPTESGFRRDKTHKKFWHRENLKKLLEKTNFKIERMFYFPFSFKFFRERIFFNELRITARKV